jgi:hypothetical protein
MQKGHKHWRQQNIGARQDFTDFCQTLADNINIYIYLKPVGLGFLQFFVTGKK